MLGAVTITVIVQEMVTGTKGFDDLAGIGLHKDLEATISEYCMVMLKIKQEIGAARMNIMTKNLKFIRIIYGGPRSQLVVIVMYVCQACGWAPKFDYDYWVIPGAKGCAHWYCAKCGGK